MNKIVRFTYLLDIYVSGRITPDEHDELLELLSTHRYDDLLAESIRHDLESSTQQGADIPPHIAEEIVRNIFTAEKNTARVLPVSGARHFISKWMVAAAIVILAAAGLYFLLPVEKAADNQYTFAALIPDSMVAKTNNSGKPEIFQLSDGTSVTMQPGSSLHYARHFAADKREVFLEGEAFFRVSKNPGKPFLVYYNNIVTKVLGTSFNINTNASTGNIEVAVKTGRVQVFENEKLLSGSRNKAVIITPNQKAVYKTLDRVFETLLIEVPQPIVVDEKEEPLPVPFVYHEEKMLEVFKLIENNYGIEIVVENSNINNCEFTGDVSKQDLYTKLKIICLTMNATYEINGTKILIKGKGCN
jgi:transmembrane sensor